ncbi:SDR family NAD(P)-dependent oxidoreductase [Spongiimicrobium salis]|uniref:SDR family NAD(P)-dependent oxidoreductase n=1 Tax=Spongiimicrobium salis TaxID=1667022 RepID=UPI00374DBEF8
MRKIAIIGGSKGIGNAILELLSDTDQIFNISRTEPERIPAHVTHYSCDILSDDLPEIDELDGLIYCPGSINLKPISRLSMEDFRADFEINVMGAVKAIQQYLPQLKKGTNPAILLFSTVASALGMPFHASVATSKSAVEGLVKSLGAELAPTIRVNAIAPTVTDTSLAAKLLRNEKMIENITQRHPLKRFLSPKEVAATAQFLMSEKAASFSGQVFPMDCGMVSFKI